MCFAVSRSHPVKQFPAEGDPGVDERSVSPDILSGLFAATDGVERLNTTV